MANCEARRVDARDRVDLPAGARAPLHDPEPGGLLVQRATHPATAVRGQHRDLQVREVGVVLEREPEVRGPHHLPVEDRDEREVAAIGAGVAPRVQQRVVRAGDGVRTVVAGHRLLDVVERAGRGVVVHVELLDLHAPI